MKLKQEQNRMTIALQEQFPKKNEKNQLLFVLDSLPYTEVDDNSPRRWRQDLQLEQCNTPTTFSSNSNSPSREPHVVRRKDLSALNAVFGVLDQQKCSADSFNSRKKSYASPPEVRRRERALTIDFYLNRNSLQHIDQKKYMLR